jgi:uncharacterized DUF497 family protein
VVNWTRFRREDYDFEFAISKLEAHDVTAEEASEVFDQSFDVRRNKSFRDRYRVTGYTHAGRAVQLIVHVESRRIRVVTGWPL